MTINPCPGGGSMIGRIIMCKNMQILLVLRRMRLQDAVGSTDDLCCEDGAVAQIHKLDNASNDIKREH